MCGRCPRTCPLEEYAEYFQASPTEASSPSCNVSPADDILAVVAEPGYHPPYRTQPRRQPR